MPLSTFHPAIQRWFRTRFGEPSPPQAAGWPLIRDGGDTLICAPTGTGKTLTAFMACLDALFRLGIDGTLEERTYVVYVSPLKALSNDIQKNLREPLEGIYAAAHDMGLLAPDIRVAVRTGDTLTRDRVAMLKRPPHILVTTPESLFILLTAARSREFLSGVRTMIVDEIHAVARDKRGAHLALTLERLDALCLAGGAKKRPQRIGLSATQRPVERVAEFLSGVVARASLPALQGATETTRAGTPALPAIVDLGHLRRVELSLEIPGSPLQSVCSHETWEEIYERLTALIQTHRTTLIFVNTRRLCERLAQHLSKRIGEDRVTSHHGSLSRAQRLSAEERLKSGSLSALVATASLELGIDIGSVDLVCQIGVTSSIGTLLQRVGRSGHSVSGVSRGKLFVLTLEELMTGAALGAAVRRGYMDELHIPPKPLDILAQQIVAASAAEDWDEDALFALVTRAYNYRDLTRAEFDEVLAMLAEGFSPRRGHNAALVHYDGVGKRVRGRRGARLAAITSGGAIPDNADYQVIQEPAGIVVGTLNEDFAVESTPGDIFQLGNTSWKILKVEPGRVRVEDAHGQPPSIPFWLGEAPARSNELSEEVTRLRREVDARLDAPGATLDTIVAWLTEESGIERAAAEQLAIYLAETKKALGVVPTMQTLALERFFDETGGMQLILHAPFGRRVNWAWGLALRKRFCRGFNFELQAAASENAVLLSLGPQHSFPLADVFHYLHSNTVQDLLVQAMLVSPIFQTRWRWDASRALALLRFSGGKKVPAALMRMRSDDLLAAVFPHAAACPETLEGDIEVPDHPLVREVVYDCLHEAMDIDGLLRALKKIEAGELKLVARDTVEPSPLAHEILTAKPYAFLDDAPLEERRTQAVLMRHALTEEDARTIGALDAGAIARVRDEAWPDPRNADELHDALMMAGFLTEPEARPFSSLASDLLATGRATRIVPATTPAPLSPRGRGVGSEGPDMLIATERVPLFEAIFPSATFSPAVTVPEKDRARIWERDAAVVEVVRGRMEVLGPTTTQAFALSSGIPVEDIDRALIALETQGALMRGHFTQTQMAAAELEWCDRRLLARIHRYTLDRLRREIEPGTAAEYMRFLFSWQHLAPAAGSEALAPGGPEAVREAIAQLQGFEIPAVAWERDILPARVKNYDRRWLDQLSLSGEVSWGRRFPAQPDPKGGRHSGQVRGAPIGLFLRDQLEHWLALAPPLPSDHSHLSGAARQVLEQLHRRGAMFFQNLARETQRLPGEIELALGELVAFGLVTGDGFGGLRALLTPFAQREKTDRRRRVMLARMKSRGLVPRAADGIAAAGRWSLFRGSGEENLFGKTSAEDAVAAAALQLLKRWGIVFHRVIARESGLPPWRDILRVYRRMEARGDLRGGRFVAGFSGEQYALPEALEHFRRVRKSAPDGRLVTLCGADPLNLAGIITPGERVAARSKNRIVFRDGMPVAVKEAREVRILEHDAAPGTSRELYAALIRKAM